MKRDYETKRFNYIFTALISHDRDWVCYREVISMTWHKQGGTMTDEVRAAIEAVKKTERKCGWISNSGALSYLSHKPKKRCANPRCHYLAKYGDYCGNHRENS